MGLFDVFKKKNELSSDEYFDLGCDKAESGNYQEAIECFSKALKLEPNDAEILNSRALAYQGLKKFELAIVDFNKAIELNPDESNFYDSRGYAFLERKLYSFAIQDFEKALELDPQNTQSLIGRGIIEMENGDISIGKQYFDKAQRIDPRTAEEINAWIQIGNQVNNKKNETENDNIEILMNQVPMFMMEIMKKVKLGEELDVRTQKKLVETIKGNPELYRKIWLKIFGVDLFYKNVDK
jgi:tetratricopeptide (TPR) repeat protein